jgi:superfamily II helicase
MNPEAINSVIDNLIADARQLPELRREIKELKAINKEMYEALEEVVALVCDSCLEYERFKELSYGRQKVVIAENPCNNCTNKVIKALRKARGEEGERYNGEE